MPLHVRAGAILPLGPVRQFIEGRVDAPLTLIVYSGADGGGMIYEDDGRSFNYRKGEWTGIEMAWRDAERRLELRLARGSRMLPPLRRPIEVRLAGQSSVKALVFGGSPVQIRL